MGKQVHYITIPPPPPIFRHSCSPSLSVSLLLVPLLIMSRSVRPAQAVPMFTTESVLLAPRPPGHACTPRRSISDGLHPGCFCVASPALCCAGQVHPAPQDCAGQGKRSMAIGPVWEALIHTTSCHLPLISACSPSAAAQPLSSVMSIFRAG